MKPTKKRTKKAPKPASPGRIPKTAAFLAAYVRTASVSKAAKSAKIHKSLHYRWLKEDQEYAGAFAAAQDEAAQILEDEAVRRAHEGVEEPVIYQGELSYGWIRNENGELVRGDKPLTIRKYSDTLLQFLLKAFRPGKYKDRGAIEHTGPGGGPIAVTDSRLAALTDTELESLTAIAEKFAVTGGPGSGKAPAQPE